MKNKKRKFSLNKQFFLLFAENFKQPISLTAVTNLVLCHSLFTPMPPKSQNHKKGIGGVPKRKLLSEKAGLTLPMTRITNMVKKELVGHPRMTTEASIMYVGILESLIHDLVDETKLHITSENSKKKTNRMLKNDMIHRAISREADCLAMYNNVIIPKVTHDVGYLKLFQSYLQNAKKKSKRKKSKNRVDN